MNNQQLEGGLQIIALGIANIINDYTNVALLINACHISKNRYNEPIGMMHLSTNGNIPPELRLDNEIDVTYTSANLVDVYGGALQNVILKNYIIMTVSSVDATLEDLYEYFLTQDNPIIDEAVLEKKIRNAWTNNSMLNYFTDPNALSLTNPVGLNMEFKEAFMRYSELRIVRHTLIHCSGKLSEKNETKLQEFHDQTPPNRQFMALLNAPIFDADRKVSLSISSILSIRKFLDRFLMFIFKAVEEKKTTP